MPRTVSRRSRRAASARSCAASIPLSSVVREAAVVLSSGRDSAARRSPPRFMVRATRSCWVPSCRSRSIRVRSASKASMRVARLAVRWPTSAVSCSRRCFLRSPDSASTSRSRNVPKPRSTAAVRARLTNPMGSSGQASCNPVTVMSEPPRWNVLGFFGEAVTGARMQVMAMEPKNPPRMNDVVLSARPPRHRGRSCRQNSTWATRASSHGLLRSPSLRPEGASAPSLRATMRSSDDPRGTVRWNSRAVGRRRMSCGAHSAACRSSHPMMPIHRRRRLCQAGR